MGLGLELEDSSTQVLTCDRDSNALYVSIRGEIIFVNFVEQGDTPRRPIVSVFWECTFLREYQKGRRDLTSRRIYMTDKIMASDFSLPRPLSRISTARVRYVRI